ncbi:MAG TPA: DUF6328 family protein [Chloroflexota bacterium]
MTSVSDKAENALNETRMLILGAQVLVGFSFQAVFQPGFDRLPPPAQEFELLGLGLMLIAVGLLIAPGAFHQIVENGNDTQRLVVYTGRVATLALLPFAIGIGLEAYIAGLVVIGAPAAVALGVLGTGFALFFWYGLDLAIRPGDGARGGSMKEPPAEAATPLETRIKQVLMEARVVLPGAQALLGFQLAAMLTDAFEKLPKSSQYVHLASLSLLAITIVFLMAPAAFHRIVERGEDTERLHRFSTAMVLGALVPLGLGLAGDFYVVANKVLGAPGTALALAAASLVFYYGLWFGVTLAVRARARGRTHRAGWQVSQAAR